MGVTLRAGFARCKLEAEGPAVSCRMRIIVQQDNRMQIDIFSVSPLLFPTLSISLRATASPLLM
jgi:hypothetical protein